MSFADAQDGTLVPSARLNIPLSTQDATWTFLGFLTDGEVAMARTTTGGEDVDVIEVGVSAQRTLQQDLPSDAQVLVPGSRVPY